MTSKVQLSPRGEMQQPPTVGGETFVHRALVLGLLCVPLMDTFLTPIGESFLERVQVLCHLLSEGVSWLSRSSAGRDVGSPIY